MKHTIETTIGCLQKRGLPDPVAEYPFHPRRKWRFDYAFPDFQVALEVEGVTPAGGRHQRVAGYEGDIEKYNAAALLGWVVIRATPRQVESGQCLAWLEAALGVA